MRIWPRLRRRKRDPVLSGQPDQTPGPSPESSAPHAPGPVEVDVDQVVADATHAAGPRVVPTGAGGGIKERDIERAFAAELPFPVKATRLHVRDWDPQPGHVDLVGDVPGLGRLLVEAKSGDIQDQLWDLFKLLAVAGPSDRAVLLAGARRSQFEGAGQCAALYRGHAWREWDSRSMFIEWERAWRRLLGGGRARPLRVPACLRTRLLARAELSVRGYELRCVVAEPVGDSWLQFDGDWPVAP